MRTLCTPLAIIYSYTLLLIGPCFLPFLVEGAYSTPLGPPDKFGAVPGERVVVFSWSPPPVTHRNGVITSYTLSCSPSLSSLPKSTSSEQTSLTVAGFSPGVSYSCSLAASNTQGSGPPANTSFTTLQDCKSGSSWCQDC